MFLTIFINTRRHPAPMSVPIPAIPERYKFCGHSSADVSSLNYYAGVRGGNQDTHDQTQYLLQVSDLGGFCVQSVCSRMVSVLCSAKPRVRPKRVDIQGKSITYCGQHNKS